MKISTRGRYALRLMLDLALHEGEYVSIKSISQRQEISSKYLEQIIISLTKSGFVKGLRGPQGGYMLSRTPEEYTIGMILELMEGELVPVACMEDNPNKCSRSESCVTLDVWKQINDAISNVVDNITLADLVRNHAEKNSQKMLSTC